MLISYHNLNLQMYMKEVKNIIEQFLLIGFICQHAIVVMVFSLHFPSESLFYFIFLLKYI